MRRIAAATLLLAAIEPPPEDRFHRTCGDAEPDGDFESVWRDDLGRGGRRRCAAIRDEVGNRHVGLVPDRRYDRRFAREDRPRGRVQR